MEEDISKEIDEKKIQSARELMQIINKTARTLKIYLPNNPIHKKFLHELTDKFQEHIDEFGSLRLKIRQNEILCEDNVIYENVNRMESISFKLFADGIREIVFNEEIEKDEIMSFVDIISRHDPNNPDDDMVTLLWEQNFSCISYRVIDDFAEVDTSVKEIDNITNLKNVLDNELKIDEISVLSSAPVSTEIAALKKTYSSIFKLTEEEIDKIKREIEKEDESDLINSMTDILFDILRVEKDVDSFLEIMDIFDKILDGLIIKGDFVHVNPILHFFKDFLNKDNGLKREYRERITQSIDKIGSRDVIKKLEPILNSEELNDVEHLFLFFTLLNKNSILSLSDLLGELQQMKIRRVICDALIELGKKDIDTLMSRLDDDRWYVTRNIIYILGKIENPRVIDKLRPFVKHKEVKLRKELIHALEIIQDEKSYELLLEFLDDDDSSIRVLSARVLADVQYKAAIKPLLRVIHQKIFYDRDIYEKKEFFAAIARIGMDEAIPFLKKIINKRRWFKKTKNNEMRLCCIMALQQIKTDAAVDILKDLQISKEKFIRDASAKVLKNIEIEGKDRTDG
ncbi:MAG: HEAT repeat domain-containing protein [Nitrospirota bacterium]